MNRILPEIWENLEKALPSGDKLVARLALPDTTDRLQCALDASGNRHLLIILRPDDDHLNDVRSRGLSVITRELTIRGQTTATYLDIECNDAAGYPVLDIIGTEISNGLAEPGTRQPAEGVKRILAKWRRFWGQLPRQLLTREEQLGLFAELWFLSEWLIPRSGSNMIDFWRGPYGSRHDFEWPDKSIEVKATTSSRGRIHRINGLDQMDVPQNGRLYLFSMHLREEGGATNNLPALIKMCRNKLVNDYEALGRLDSALLQIGYSPLYEEEYAKLNLRIIEETLFAVRDDFPRLLPMSFLNGVPEGIERIDYEINLNTYGHLIVARRWDEWIG
ncbi:MAG: PD-(D/E)XK motif protein [Dehalococcoidia bacterium]